MGRACSVDGCGRKHIAKGFCTMHYQRHAKGRPIGGASRTYAPSAITDMGDALAVAMPGSGLEFMVSPCDRAVVEGRRWCRGGCGYPSAFIDGKSELLHRILMRPGEGLHVDHINGNRLDCRRENMRIVTPAQNAQNRSGSGLSGHRNVIKGSRPGTWRVRITSKGRRVYGGTFTDVEKAADAARQLRAKFMTHHNPARHMSGDDE